MVLVVIGVYEHSYNVWGPHIVEACLSVPCLPLVLQVPAQLMFMRTAQS